MLAKLQKTIKKTYLSLQKSYYLIEKTNEIVGLYGKDGCRSIFSTHLIPRALLWADCSLVLQAGVYAGFF